ncbi:hypothetical protein AB833_18215 [Chromatiales bacterium (ex Bugula neritina AB1)]|nr:hypothetical protein AB833_18215 [Chromatiales bacterium (ex Bugula neritina AB1)]
MANIVILGAGVMGSALSVPAAAGNSVTLVGSPLDDAIISEVRETGRHPGLNVDLPQSIQVSTASEQNTAAFENADVIVIGVSSPGVDWALVEIARYRAKPDVLALVTKGLVSGAGAAPQTYAQYIDPQLTSTAGRIVGIGGPCIARELALGIPTRVSFAALQLSAANDLRDLLQTEYYRVTTSTDITALEACAALKNFMCIGVSAMYTAYATEEGHAKNPLAALFNQAVLEIDLLSRWIVSGVAKPDVDDSDEFSQSNRTLSAFDLPGMGDLHVTVGGGRNSRLGKYLGSGRRLQQVQRNEMHGVTVEGVDTGRQLSAGFQAACENGELDAHVLPLTAAILACIDQDLPFKFDFSSLPG